MAGYLSCEVGDFYSMVMHEFEQMVDSAKRDLQADVYAAADDATSHLKADVGDWSQTEDLPERERLHYERGWKAYKHKPTEEGVEAVVANANAPQLTHLIENGHELFVFGRDTGRRTKARPHIKDAYEYAAARHFKEGGG